MNRFIETNIVVSHRYNGSRDDHVVPMVNCKPEWFAMVDDQSVVATIGSRVCADKDALEKIWRVKGQYTNRADRYRVHLEINRCNPKFNDNC